MEPRWKQPPSLNLLGCVETSPQWTYTTLLRSFHFLCPGLLVPEKAVSAGSDNVMGSDVTTSINSVCDVQQTFTTNHN